MNIYRYEDITPRLLGRYKAPNEQMNGINQEENLLIDLIDICHNDTSPYTKAHKLIKIKESL